LKAFYEFNDANFTFFLISFVKRIQNDVEADVMRDDREMIFSVT